MWNTTDYQAVDEVTDDPYAVTHGVRILHATLIAILGTIGALGNFMVILSIATTPDLRTSHNLMILNLSTADFLFSIITESLYCVSVALNRWPFGPAECRLSVKVSLLLMGVSIVTLATVAINRFILISKPHAYDKFCSRSKTIASIVLLWVLAFVVVFVISELTVHFETNFNPVCGCCTLDPLDPDTQVFVTILNVLVIFTTFLMITTLYSLMFRVIRASKRRVRAVQVTVPDTAENNDLSHADSSGGGPVGEPRPPECTISKEEISMAKMSFLVTVLFLVCWLPQSITYIFGWKHSVVLRTGRFNFFLIILGPALNPFIYAWMNAKVRKACLRLVTCQSCIPGTA
ncbi:beta-1 adrenergic receptor-like [Asterias amurensis]|uniref:beta-1 adrenergic receptor-like n=1 Tax=Asterias amurensis TaxID=7602 RepID=UPI003AB7F8C5